MHMVFVVATTTHLAPHLLKYKRTLKVTADEIRMKDYSYYETIDVEYPNKTKYTKSFFYKRGRLIATKVWGEGYDDLEFKLPEGTVEEKVLDEESYNAHQDLYNSRRKEKQDEFKTDLLEKHRLTNHPQSDKLYNIAWGLGSGELLDVDLCLLELTSIIDKSQSNCSNTDSFVDKITFTFDDQKSN